MSREIMQQALDALENAKIVMGNLTSDNCSDCMYIPVTKSIAALKAELAKPEQEPVSHLWECIGRWSAYLAANGKQGNLAPPEWLVDAVKAATSPPRKPWVGLTNEEVLDILACNRGELVAIQKAQKLLKDKNTT